MKKLFLFISALLLFFALSSGSKASATCTPGSQYCTGATAFKQCSTDGKTFTNYDCITHTAQATPPGPGFYCEDVTVSGAIADVSCIKGCVERGFNCQSSCGQGQTKQASTYYCPSAGNVCCSGAYATPTPTMTPTPVPQPPPCTLATSTSHTACVGAPNTCSGSGTQTLTCKDANGANHCVHVACSSAPANCDAGKMCQTATGTCVLPVTPTPTPTPAPLHCDQPQANPSQVTPEGTSNLSIVCTNAVSYRWHADNSCGSITSGTNTSNATFTAPATSATCQVGVDVMGPLNLGTTFYVNIPVVATPTLTPTSTPTLTPTPTVTPSPTPPPQDTIFSLTIGLDGIGSTGDNANPNSSSGSNKNPLHATRNIVLQLYDANNVLVLEKTGSITYDPTSGKFTGTVNVGHDPLLSGDYTVKVKSDGYLSKAIPGIQHLVTTNTVENVTPLPVNLVAGDIYSDNALNIQDYNILISCSIFSTDSTLCSSNSVYQTLSDLDDNGTIDQFDYNLFVREYSVQNGQ